MNNKKSVCIGICCFNEEKNIPIIYRRITEEMQAFPEIDYNILFEDNCSEDHSQEVLEHIVGSDKHVRAIFNKTNFGLLRSGVNLKKNMTGDALIVINCDLQDPPELIPDFINGWLNGYDIVWGQKRSSDENGIKFFFRKVFYKIIGLFSDHKLYEQVTGFGLMDKSVVDALLPTQEQDPEVAARFLVGEYGFKMLLIPYRQNRRLYGKSTFSKRGYYSFAITSLCSTSIKPLRIMTIIGLLASVISCLCGFVYLIMKIFFWKSFSMGIAPIVIGLFFLSSVQLFSMGILGEYVALVLRKVTNKTTVIEERRIGFNEDME